MIHKLGFKGVEMVMLEKNLYSSVGSKTQLSMFSQKNVKCLHRNICLFRSQPMDSEKCSVWFINTGRHECSSPHTGGILIG